MMTLLIGYLLLLALVFLAQRKLMYFPARYNPSEHSAMLKMSNMQAWPNENNIRGLISRTPITDLKGVILVFHGNAGSAIHRQYFIEALEKLDYRVIIAEYPGYGVRPGSPSEKRLIKDGIETARLVQQTFQSPLFLLGESLGGGIVSGIVDSGEVTVKGLLLITPFDKMSEVAQHHYWYLFGKWITLDKYDNIDRLSRYAGNTAVILAEQDEVIPKDNTLALFNAISGNKKLWRFQAGHNSLPMQPYQSWWKETMMFLDD